MAAFVPIIAMLMLSFIHLIIYTFKHTDKHTHRHRGRDLRGDSGGWSPPKF